MSLPSTCCIFAAIKEEILDFLPTSLADTTSPPHGTEIECRSGGPLLFGVCSKGYELSNPAWKSSNWAILKSDLLLS